MPLQLKIRIDDKDKVKITKLSGQLDDLGDRTTRTGSRMGRAFGSLRKGLTGTIGLVTSLAGAYAGLKAVQTMTSFASATNRVKAVTQATTEEMVKLTDQAQALGISTQFSATQAAEGMGFLAQAGFDVNDVYAAMPGVLQLAASAQIEVATAADIASNVLTGYSLQVEDLTRVNDTLVAAFTSANTDLRQLGEAMKFAGPLASAAGVGFEEAAATVALFGNAGIQGTMAGTALRGIIGDLLNPTESAQKALRRLGISVKDTAGNMLPMVDIVRQFEAAGADVNDVIEIFDVRSVGAFQSLISQGSPALDELTKKLAGAGGLAEAVANTQMEGLPGAIKAVTSAASGLVLALGESGISGAFEGVIRVVTTFLRALAESEEALAFVKGAATAAAAAFLVMNAPIVGVVVAIGALITIGVLLFRNFKNTFSALLNILEVFTRGARTRLSEIATAAWDFLVKGFNAIIMPVIRVFQRIGQAILDTVNFIREKAGLNSLGAFVLDSVVDGITDGGRITTAEMAASFKAGFDAIKADAAASAQDIARVIAAARAAFAGGADQQPQSVSNEQAPMIPPETASQADLILTSIEPIPGVLSSAEQEALALSNTLAAVGTSSNTVTSGVGDIAVAGINGFGAMKVAAEDFAASILRDLARIIAQMLIIKALGSVFSGFGAGSLATSFIGVLSGKATGGPIGGTGIGDTQLIRAEPGEYVMRAQAVNQIGEANLAAMNRGERPRGGGGSIAIPITINLEGDDNMLEELRFEASRIAEETLAPAMRRLMKQRDIRR